MHQSFVDININSSIVSSYVKVRFYDNFAAFFDLELNSATDLPAVVVISSCKITQSTNSISSVINMPPTRFYINPPIGMVLDIRKRYSCLYFLQIRKTKYSSNFHIIVTFNNNFFSTGFGICTVGKKLFYRTPQCQILNNI